MSWLYKDGDPFIRVVVNVECLKSDCQVQMLQDLEEDVGLLVTKSGQLVSKHLLVSDDRLLAQTQRVTLRDAIK